MGKRRPQDGVGWALEADGRARGSSFAAPAGPRETKWETKPETPPCRGFWYSGIFSPFARKSYLGSGHKGVSAHPVSPETKPLWGHEVTTEVHDMGKIVDTTYHSVEESND